MNNPLAKTRVLVVEDEIVVSEDLQQRLVDLGFEVAGAADTGADAIRLATTTRPDVALMDIMLHGRPEGIDAADHLRKQLDIPVIFLTAHSDAATLQKAKLTDPSGYIVKPFDQEQLRVAIEMAPARHEMERKARRVALWLGATLTSIGDAVIATDPGGKILLLNPAAETLTGWTQGEAAGKPCGEVLRLVHQGTGQPLEDPALRALREGVMVRLDPDTLLISRSGEERFVDDSASPIVDPKGRTLGAVVVIVDATDRIAAQDRVQTLKRQVKELLTEKDKHEMLSAEVEAFAAAVSHDLRAPLRAIAGFSDILSESYRHQLDSAGQHFLDRVRANADRMNRMVEDYLVFLSSTRQRPLRMTQVDLNRLVQTAFADFAAVPGQHSIGLVSDTLPPIWGDELMVQQLLDNLLGNAIKFSGHRQQPVVEVGTLPGGDLHTFFVRDNGAGLDLAKAEKLFEPFRRFHSAAEFPGTGVGLAIVKRIVECHGGRVWAESQPDAGATFFFTLPAAPPS